jgi:hypothetical protein
VNYGVNMPFRFVTAANVVGDHAAICADLGYAVFASESLLSKVKFPV